MLANEVEVRKTIVETVCEDGRAVLTVRSKAATVPKGTTLNGAKRYTLVNPSFSAAAAPLFRRALSVGVTFLDATGVYPDIGVPSVNSELAKTLAASPILLCEYASS